MAKRIIFCAVLLVPLFIVDRLTKYLAETRLPEGGVFISNFFNLRLFFNPHLAFSLPLANLVTIILTPIILIFLIYFLIKASKTNGLVMAGLGLILIGAFSNLIDRLRFSGVIDFINFSFWPAFNLSDVYIVAGAVLLFLFIFKNGNGR